MNIYKYVQAMLAMSFIGVMSGAASDVSPSVQRVIRYFNIVEDALKYRSPVLQKGIDNFLGTHAVPKNFSVAAFSFRTAGNSADQGVRAKAFLYAAALLFVGDDVVQQNYSAAGQMAEKIVHNVHALPVDRIRAYLLLDEIMHVSNGRFKLDIPMLREAAEQVATLTCEHNELTQELLYRLARSFYYDGGGEHGDCLTRVVMFLNLISRTNAVEGLSLYNDIEALRARTATALPTEKMLAVGLRDDVVLTKPIADVPSSCLANQHGGALSQYRRSPPIEDFGVFEQSDLQAAGSAPSSTSLRSSFGLRPSRALKPDEWDVLTQSVSGSQTIAHVAPAVGCSDDDASTSTGSIVPENSQANVHLSNRLTDAEWADVSTELRSGKRAERQKFSLSKYRTGRKKYRKK